MLWNGCEDARIGNGGGRMLYMERWHGVVQHREVDHSRNGSTPRPLVPTWTRV